MLGRPAGGCRRGRRGVSCHREHLDFRTRGGRGTEPRWVRLVVVDVVRYRSWLCDAHANNEVSNVRLLRAGETKRRILFHGWRIAQNSAVPSESIGPVGDLYRRNRAPEPGRSPPACAKRTVGSKVPTRPTVKTRSESAEEKFFRSHGGSELRFLCAHQQTKGLMNRPYCHAREFKR